MQYLAYDKCDDVPNIIVDGRATRSTVLCLSHWRGSGTPDELKADLSAEIVFNYLDRQDKFGKTAVGVGYASNNHFDEDGLVGLYALLHPDEAMAQRDLLIDVASAGDFGKYRDRDAARVSFVLAAWQDADRSPLKESIFALPYQETSAVLYEELLPRLGAIVTKIDHFEPFWSEPDQLLTKTEENIDRGAISITEYADLDLAVVTADGIKTKRGEPRWSESIHPFAIHNATEMLRVLLVSDQRYEFYYRYETWVELHSRKTRPRIDLSRLAGELTALEGSQGKWEFDGCDGIVPHLSIKGKEKSALLASDFLEKLAQYLSRE